MKYKLVMCGAPVTFEERVNELLENGWKFHGVTFIAKTGNFDHFYQAMTKE